MRRPDGNLGKKPAPVGLLLPDLIKPLGDQPNDPRLEETIP